MKYLVIVLGLVLGTFQAHAQGTLTLAMNTQQNANGQPLAGALLYTYVTGTVATPQLTYQDTGLTLTQPWPLVADQNGRIPLFYLPAGTVHVRLTDASGNVQLDYANALVIGGTTTGGGPSGPGVDPTSVSSTGDVKFRLSNENLAGWVILNGQTIGNATSGATGLASATAQALFVYLWTYCPNTHCPVAPGGRGATALADFSAGKALQLMDMRDRIPVGRDCMGNTCLAGLLLSNITSGGSDTADTPGASGGLANYSLLAANLPTFTIPALTIASGQGAHTHSLSPAVANVGAVYDVGTGTNAFIAGTSSSATQSAILPSMVTTAQNYSGSDTAFSLMNPFRLGTWYIKL